MRNFLYSFFIVVTAFNSLQGGNVSQMLQDLDVIKNTFETKYAPYEWKKSYFGWSLEEEIQIAKVKVLSFNSLTVKEYQRILHAFFMSTRDYHVHGYYHSTEASTLPFSVTSVNGKYYITNIDVRALHAMQEAGLYSDETLFEIGNQIILFDGAPIEEVVENLKYQELGNPTSKTSQRLAEKILTKRIGALGHSIPQGNLLISFKTKEGAIVDTVIEWVHIPEKIKNQSYTSAIATFGKYDEIGLLEQLNSRTARHSLQTQNAKMINPLAQMLQKDYSTEIYEQLKLTKNKLSASSKSEVGLEDRSEGIIAPEHSAEEQNKKFTLDEKNDDEEKAPPVSLRAISREEITFGEILWKEPEPTPFRAHLYRLSGSNKKIGYIRIPTYNESDDDQSEATQLVLNLARSLQQLESNSDALIVDQVDNPGGNLLYALAITSMLTNRPLSLPKNQISVTQKEIERAVNNLPFLEEEAKKIEEFTALFPGARIPYRADSFFTGFPLDLLFFLNQISYCNFVIDQWNQGKAFTIGFPVLGIDQLQPHPLSQYSKPILMLTNSCDFSCADFVPAILQDNERAIIFGEQTAGAGGAVEVHRYPNSFGLKKFSYTVSLAERLNGLVIENLGVTPDVPYEITENDLFNGYKEYAQAVNMTLWQMLNESSSD